MAPCLEAIGACSPLLSFARCNPFFAQAWLALHYFRRVTAFERGAQTGLWRVPRWPWSVHTMRRIAPRNLERAVQFLTGRFSTSRPGWQFVLWLRQLAMTLLAVMGDVGRAASTGKTAQSPPAPPNLLTAPPSRVPLPPSLPPSPPMPPLPPLPPPHAAPAVDARHTSPDTHSDHSSRPSSAKLGQSRHHSIACNCKSAVHSHVHKV